MVSLESLNTHQRNAVLHSQGPLLVLAGAGSGKTRVITQRIAQLVNSGIRPESIMAVSFTNKAAEEMQARMRKLMPKDACEKLWLSTFHRFGVRFLNAELHHAWGRGGFTMFDQSDSVGLVRSLLREQVQDRRMDATAVQAQISLWKGRLLDAKTLPAARSDYENAARAIYSAYQEALRALRAVDFDDLVGLCVSILRHYPDIQRRWSERFRHLLIDEFQDTNHAQLELVRLLANPMRNVCVVGDDDQSIYSWRGAEVSNILDFESHFPNTRVIKLEDNYRSRPPILAAANGLMQQVPNKKYLKTLRATRSDNDSFVRRCVVDDAEMEARAVSAEIRNLINQCNYRYQDIAVLYRSNQQARRIEEELRINHQPYQLLGGMQYFDRKEVKDAIAYLRTLVNPGDALSIRRMLQYPSRGIGPQSVERLNQHAQAQDISLYRALGQATQVPGLPPAARQSAGYLFSILESARQRLLKGEAVHACAETLLREAGFTLARFEQDYGASARKRHDNIQFLLRSIERYERNHAEPKPSIQNFLTRLTLRINQEEESQHNRVTLSTLHAVKGLEFPVVFMIGCVEGQIPHSRSTNPKANDASPISVDEERRLFYVGMTRAQDLLYCMCPRRKSLRGTLTPLTPTRFLQNLPEESVRDYVPVMAKAMQHDEIASMAQAILNKLDT